MTPADRSALREQVTKALIDFPDTQGNVMLYASDAKRITDRIWPILAAALPQTRETPGPTPDQNFGSAVRQPDGRWFCVVIHRGLVGSADSYEGAITKVQELLATARGESNACV